MANGLSAIEGGNVKTVVGRYVSTVCRWCVAVFDRFGALRERVYDSKRAVAKVWAGQQGLQSPDQSAEAAYSEHSLTPFTDAAPSLADVRAQVESFSGAPFAEAYAEYLGLHLIQLHCDIGIQIRHRERMDSEIRNFIVFQIRALGVHPLATHDQCIALVPYLEYHNQDVAEAAQETFKALSQRRFVTTVLAARIEFVEGNAAIVRFEHPILGIVEREFKLTDLPLGSDAGDSFDLRVEVNAARQVVAYQPMRRRLEKHVLANWEAVPVPPAPKNLNDPEEMAQYDKAMDEYMAKTTAMLAPEAEQWRAARKADRH
jgi:hypothetical protein